MKLTKAAKKLKSRKRSMRSKLSLSLLCIAAILVISCVISILEYTRMSDYVSELVAEDITGIDVARRLGDAAARYNLDLLTVIGDESSASLPDYDAAFFKESCEELRSSLASERINSLADSVMYSYSAYMLTSRELENVIMSDFIDTRSWYYERLQPRFERLKSDIDALSGSIHDDLKANSATFERGFYRSTIPGIVAVGVAILLVFLLLFFLLVYYVNPLYRMLDALNGYRSADKTYSVKFDGDDQLAELNEGISEVANENLQLRSRLISIRNKAKD